MKEPKFISEYYQIQSTFIKPAVGKLKINYTSFIWKHNIVKGKGAIQIDVHYEVLNMEDIKVCELINRAIFSVENVLNNDSSKKLLDQLFYKAYDSFLKVYEIHYKNSVVNKKEPYFPLSFDEVLSEVLNSFDE
jgi:hypothetical protein